jgi:hypothetical protein
MKLLAFRYWKKDPFEDQITVVTQKYIIKVCRKPCIMYHISLRFMKRPLPCKLYESNTVDYLIKIALDYSVFT